MAVSCQGDMVTPPCPTSLQGSQHLSGGQLPPLPVAHVVPQPRGASRRGGLVRRSSQILIGIPGARRGSWRDGSGVTAVTGNASHGDSGSRRVGSRASAPRGSGAAFSTPGCAAGWMLQAGWELPHPGVLRQRGQSSTGIHIHVPTVE